MPSWRWARQEPPPRPEHEAVAVTRHPKPHKAILEVASTPERGGLFVGSAPDDGSYDNHGGAPLVFTKPRRCLLVCAPSQTGKTSALAIPQMLAAPGPALCTSTKLDIFNATALVRATHGQVWVYDPGGTETLPPGARPLRWSPIVSSGTWDQAMATARAMVKVAGSGQGLKNEAFWAEQAMVVLGVLLYRAALTKDAKGRPADMSHVLTWLAEKNADSAAKALLAAGGDKLAVIAASGIGATPWNEQSGYWSTASVTVRAYWSTPALAATTNPNFDAAEFVDPPPGRFDTVYVTGGTDDQEQFAPLIVGMVESIRKAAYEAARRRGGFLDPPLYLVLDEAGNICPLPGLVSLISEGPGRGVYTAAYFQSLQQAVPRWGDQAKDFLTLFTEKAILPGVMDKDTIERFSLIVGEYDREVPGWSVSDTGKWGEKNRTESWSIQRQPILPPSQVTAGPGEGYFWYHSPEIALWEGHIAALALTPWYLMPPWPQVIISAMSAYEGPGLPLPNVSAYAYDEALFPGASDWAARYEEARIKRMRTVAEQYRRSRRPPGEQPGRHPLLPPEPPPMPLPPLNYKAEPRHFGYVQRPPGHSDGASMDE